ncbi:MAG: hypothetical protein LBR51_03760, partial [Bacteroidales bacterium]|nr:hypothetical protein [Bacteroidales bacterium]
DYLESIARAALLQKEKPERFTDWIYWKFGDKIANDYMLPYNEKIWSCDLNTLGTYWLEKLPNVSFRDTLASCLNRSFYGALPGHAQFYYPLHTGYGEIFTRMAVALGDKVRYDYTVTELNPETRTVNGDIEADCIINTAPWTTFSRGLGQEAEALVAHLKHTSVDIDYYPEASDTDAHWTYYASPTLSYHRKIHRDNIVDGSRGFWTETNARRRCPLGMAHFENEYAYPLNTIDKPEAISALLAMMREHNIIGLGRWGEWEHFNSDVVMERALDLADRI